MLLTFSVHILLWSFVERIQAFVIFTPIFILNFSWSFLNAAHGSATDFASLNGSTAICMCWTRKKRVVSHDWNEFFFRFQAFIIKFNIGASYFRSLSLLIIQRSFANGSSGFFSSKFRHQKVVVEFSFQLKTFSLRIKALSFLFCTVCVNCINHSYKIGRIQTKQRYGMYGTSFPTTKSTHVLYRWK